MPPVQQPLCDNVVGRWNGQTVGCAYWRFHKEPGDPGQWRVGRCGVEDSCQRNETCVCGRQPEWHGRNQTFSAGLRSGLKLEQFDI